jgi:hypothetical protein
MADTAAIQKNRAIAFGPVAIIQPTEGLLVEDELALAVEELADWFALLVEGFEDGFGLFAGFGDGVAGE